MISFVLPTRNRPGELSRTVSALAELGIEGAELIVIDNASDLPPRYPRSVGGLSVSVIELPENAGAAARNIGARRASHDWLVMLDDDSAPLDTELLDAIADAGPRTGAISADITLPDGTREHGGLPEVFVGCGAAIRRDVFLSLGGYDRSFDYYAEEYDLCARLIASGRRVVFDPRFRVLHRKVDAGRDFGAILRRLVRNNGWVIARHAPASEVGPELDAMLGRYAAIAQREGVVEAFAKGHTELRETIADQQRTPMSEAQWARFTGLTPAGESLTAQVPDAARTAAIVEPGKGEPVVRRALAEHGLIIVGDAAAADVLAIGTLSPGPMLDALARLGDDPRVIAPWLVAERLRRSPAAAA